MLRAVTFAHVLVVASLLIHLGPTPVRANDASSAARQQPAAAPALPSVSDRRNSTTPVSTLPPETLQQGASGRLVETLQRTLNVRLTPSPELSIDGDFGQVTRQTVEAFQRSQKLTVNGIVDARTWKALGTLVTTDPPVPPPSQVNAEQLPKEPADSLWGPPHVTCKAWAVGDGCTGSLLWGEHADQRLDFASTTKVMTAHVVIQLARTDASVLNEIVSFSQRADDTRGSTAGIRAGESLSVRELLYGLMLPSGNDASIALAEHFGRRFTPSGQVILQDRSASEFRVASSTDPKPTPVELFVARMNRTALELGMRETHYENPHGLTADGHKSSARDLLRLAWTAMQDPLYRQYVGTRQHGCQLTAGDGTQRNVVWKNTNQLLKIEGYQGVKTGTTSAAGACLVAFGERYCDKLIVVVLGSNGSSTRYVDTRNLFRWAWITRGHRW